MFKIVFYDKATKQEAAGDEAIKLELYVDANGDVFQQEEDGRLGNVSDAYGWRPAQFLGIVIKPKDVHIVTADSYKGKGSFKDVVIKKLRGDKP